MQRTGRQGGLEEFYYGRPLSSLFLCFFPTVFLTTPNLFPPYPIYQFLDLCYTFLITLALWYVSLTGRICPLKLFFFCKMFLSIKWNVQVPNMIRVPCTNSVRLGDDTTPHHIDRNCITWPSQPQLRLKKRLLNWTLCNLKLSDLCWQGRGKAS